MKRIIFILLISIFLANPILINAQIKPGVKVKAIVVNNDTIPYIELPVARVYGNKIFASKKDKKRWDRLVYNVKRVYSLAKISGIKMKDYEKLIIKAKNDHDRKVLMKNAEAQLKTEFEKDIRDMTYSQGKILVKLIDRETGKTSYQIIKDFRGSIQALFWQTLARIFDGNLKLEYDPFGDDKDIEEIVLKIESGDI